MLSTGQKKALVSAIHLGPCTYWKSSNRSKGLCNGSLHIYTFLNMNILGISAYYHDSAACLVTDGVIIAAAQEERFTRIKHDANFPGHAIRYCLQEAGIIAAELDFVVFFDKPFLKFERILETYLAFAPRGFKNFAISLPVWLKDKLFQKKLIIEALKMELGPEIDLGKFWKRSAGCWIPVLK